MGLQVGNKSGGRSVLLRFFLYPAVENTQRFSLATYYSNLPNYQVLSHPCITFHNISLSPLLAILYKTKLFIDNKYIHPISCFLPVIVANRNNNRIIPTCAGQPSPWFSTERWLYQLAAIVAYRQLLIPSSLSVP